MNHFVRTVLLIMLLSVAALTKGQTFEVPNIEYPDNLCELRDENRVFVHAPLNTRQQIVKELREHSSLFIVERPEEADFLLLFTYSPFIDGSADGTLSDANGARAELAVVRFVNHQEGQVRPRILFYWSAQKSFRSFPLPFTGISPNGFARPRSGKGAAEELIMRLALWAVHKKWPTTFYFDQFTNQLTISVGGKLEKKGTKAFLKALKNARSDNYAHRCLGRPKLSLSGSARPLASGRTALPVAPVTAADSLLGLRSKPPLIQRRRSTNGRRPRPVKRRKERRRTANKKVSEDP